MNEKRNKINIKLLYRLTIILFQVVIELLLNVGVGGI